MNGGDIGEIMFISSINSRLYQSKLTGLYTHQNCLLNKINIFYGAVLYIMISILGATIFRVEYGFHLDTFIYICSLLFLLKNSFERL